MVTARVHVKSLFKFPFLIGLISREEKSIIIISMYIESHFLLFSTLL